MTKFILPILLSLYLAACAADGTSNVTDEQQLAQLYQFIQLEVNLAIDTYGEDFLEDLGQTERFVILSHCNAAAVFSTGSDLPEDAPAQVYETCKALRTGMGS